MRRADWLLFALLMLSLPVLLLCIDYESSWLPVFAAGFGFSVFIDYVFKIMKWR